jgi:hypothetical protein
MALITMNGGKDLEAIGPFLLNFTLRWTQMCDTTVTTRALFRVLVFLHKICSNLHPTVGTNAWEEHGMELARSPLTSVAEVTWISSFIYLSICLSVCLAVYLFVYLSVCLSTYLSICLSTYLSIYLSIYLPVSLSVCISIYLPNSLSVCLSAYLSIYLFIYGSTALCWTLVAFLVSKSFTQSVGLFGRGSSLSQGRYLHTGQHKHRIKTHRHLYLTWDSNPRFQCLRGRRWRGNCDRLFFHKSRWKYKVCSDQENPKACGHKMAIHPIFHLARKVGRNIVILEANAF